MIPLAESIEAVRTRAYTIPTDRQPESDGTLTWSTTTIVVVEITSGDRLGIGYSYTAAAAARLIDDVLVDRIVGREATDVRGAWREMVDEVRNLGCAGVAASAISAVDTALWDLKGRLLDRPLASLLGAVRDSVPIYGSGGFTSYSVAELAEQLGGWVADGMHSVKMKVGRRPETDPERVRAAREAIGDAGLMVDANGAYDRKQALAMAEVFAVDDVSWFEEPVSSDDLEGLRLVRDRCPPGLEVAAGEYGWNLFDFHRLLDAGAVDVLQADATRCLGITGFLEAATLAWSRNIPFSAHTAPALHLHPACAVHGMLHVEWLHDHVRMERLLFDGAPDPVAGKIRPDLSRPGLGLDLKLDDARSFQVYGTP